MFLSMAQAPTATARRTGRLDYLDGLRGIAVLLVLVFHVAERWPALAHDRLGYLAGFGSRGVEVFFVLSGLCLAYPTLRARANGDRQPFDVRRYAARRIARIVPPYYAAIAVFAALSFTPLWRAAAAFAPHCLRATIPLRGTIEELLFVDRAYPMHNLSFWSLAIEFRWYFLFPLALGLMLANARAFYAVLAGVAALDLSGKIASNDLGALPSFLLGIVVADAVVHERSRPSRALPCRAFIPATTRRSRGPRRASSSSPPRRGAAPGKRSCARGRSSRSASRRTASI
jgi:peptidoglycan/LPS O-acetylase OafA/YrhL